VKRVRGHGGKTEEKLLRFEPPISRALVPSAGLICHWALSVLL